MTQPFSDNIREIADSMGISLYQRFSFNEAALFLRCSFDDLKNLQQKRKISFIQVTADQIEFFGFQLLEYLLQQVKVKTPDAPSNQNPERIIRAKELKDITGLSRTTIWRMERTGNFPQRVALCPGSIGWRYSEVMEWMKTRK